MLSLSSFVLSTFPSDQQYTTQVCEAGDQYQTRATCNNSLVLLASTFIILEEHQIISYLRVFKWSQAFARALVPDRAVRVPPETEELVDAFIGELLPLLDVNNDMEELCPCGTADVALMRLAASAALLRLARAHDSRIHPEIFIPLALTVQVGFNAGYLDNVLRLR